MGLTWEICNWEETSVDNGRNWSCSDDANGSTSRGAVYFWMGMFFCPRFRFCTCGCSLICREWSWTWLGWLCVYHCSKSSTSHVQGTATTWQETVSRTTTYVCGPESKYTVCWLFATHCSRCGYRTRRIRINHETCKALCRVGRNNTRSQWR